MNKTLEELALECPITFKEVREIISEVYTVKQCLATLASWQYLYAEAMVKERTDREELKENNVSST